MSTYSPVSYEFRDMIEEATSKQSEGKVFFFNDGNELDSCEGRVAGTEEVPGRGIYLLMTSGEKVRIDRIITLFGKPGAAFDEYDSYANQCLSCTGGYDL